jgi:hypothetical protein
LAPHALNSAQATSAQSPVFFIKTKLAVERTARELSCTCDNRTLKHVTNLAVMQVKP